MCACVLFVCVWCVCVRVCVCVCVHVCLIGISHHGYFPAVAVEQKRPQPVSAPTHSAHAGGHHIQALSLPLAEGLPWPGAVDGAVG